MKARTKITFWTSLFALVVAITFSGFVFFEFVEQPIRLIDRELRDIRDLTTQYINKTDGLPYKRGKVLTQHPFGRYWIEVTDNQGNTLLKTRMIEHTQIPSRPNDRFYFENRPIALNHIWIAEEDRDELDESFGKTVYFRVLRENLKLDNEVYKLLIAKPLPILIPELKELVVEVLLFIILSTIIAILASYYLAGKILSPITQINSLIREIKDDSLHKRIPVGPNKDELYILSSSLNDMFDRLQYSFERQKEYIGNASHELKSPLTILTLGHEKILSEQLPKNLRNPIEKQLTMLHRISKLVRNLLEISRLEQHESFNKQEFNLKELVQHVVEEFEDLIQAQKLDLHSDLQITNFIGDPDKILQMLINLLDNSIKYNLPSNGQIWISTNSANGNVVFTISNTGLTIPADSLEKIFEQFFRVEKSRSTIFGGSGLGLTIVKHIVEMHDATIVASCDKGDLTTFTITFPSSVS